MMRSGVCFSVTVAYMRKCQDTKGDLQPALLNNYRVRVDILCPTGVIGVAQPQTRMEPCEQNSCLNEHTVTEGWGVISLQLKI